MKKKFREKFPLVVGRMKRKKWNNKGLIGVGFVMAVFVAILLFIGLASGGLGALWRAGSTVADVVDILGSIPGIAWIFIGFFCLLSLMRGKKRR